MRGKRTKTSQRRSDVAAKQRRVNKLVTAAEFDSEQGWDEEAAEKFRRAGSIVNNNDGVTWPEKP
jgi:hypothetical protein